MKLTNVMSYLGEHKPGRIKSVRIKRAALSLQNPNYYIFFCLIRPRLYASDICRPGGRELPGLPQVHARRLDGGRLAGRFDPQRRHVILLGVV